MLYGVYTNEDATELNFDLSPYSYHVKFFKNNVDFKILVQIRSDLGRRLDFISYKKK